MQSQVRTPDEYVAELPDDRRESIEHLRKEIRANLPDGFVETMGYGMIGYVVPHSRYPAGYHCDPKFPLPFLAIASQKQSVNIYHMGLYSDDTLKDWFLREYPKRTDGKLDMGKSCIRFKKPDQIPYGLFGELAGKMTVADWIATYEAKLKR